MASLTFVNAYSVDTALSPAGKEQNDIFFFDSGLGSAFISDGASGLNFSGNDVSAVGLNIGGNTYYGWISRPIKSGGIVRGFYFWADAQFTSLALAQADGNTDGDGNPYDNIGFVLVVDQAWFNSLSETSPGVMNVGSSSDRVDTALNSLIVVPKPVATADTATAVEAGGVSNGTAGSDGTGNALTNDTGDTLHVTNVGTSSASSSVASSTTSANGTAVAGAYGTLTIGADGTYKYVVNNGNASVEALRTSANTLTETFTYKVTDSHNATATNTITVTIQGANDGPTAVDDYNTAKVSIAASNNYTASDLTGAKATGNVLSNDTDKDSGDTKAITGLGASADFVGYTQGGTTQTLSFSSSQGNSLNSVAVGDYAYTTAITTNHYYILLDSAGNQIKITSKVQNADGTYSIGLSATPAKYNDGTDHTYALSNGSLVDFATTANNGGKPGGIKEATVSTATATFSSTLTVSGAGASDIAIGMTVTGTNIPANTHVTAISSSGGNVVLTLDQQLNSAPSGSFAFAGSAGATLNGLHGTFVLNTDGTYTYTPTINDPTLPSGTSAVENFQYTMQDAAGATSTATLHITVFGSSASDPNAVDDTASATEAGGVNNGTAGTNPTGNVLANDTTPAGSNTVSSAKTTASSSFTTVGTNTSIAGQWGTLTLNSNGTYTYTVDNTNATVAALKASTDTLTDTFNYKVTNTGSLSDYATLTVTVHGADDAPIGTDDTGAAVEKSGTNNAVAGFSPSGNVLSNDTDVDDASRTVTAVRAGATEGSGTAGTIGTALTGAHGTLTLNANGTWSYAVDENDSAVNALASGQSLTDSFNYTVSDGTLTDTAVITITINGDSDTVTVNDVFVNEASPYAMFKVTGLTGMPVTLSLGNTAGLTIPPDQPVTLGTDLSNTLEYYNGSAWVTYSGSATIPAGGTLLVRVAINNDTTYEGSEAFTLNVTTSDGSLSRGIGTINDEGTGDTFGSANTTGNSDGTGTDDDRPTVSIGDVTVTEGGIAVFTVSLDHASTQAIHFTPSVASGTATVGTDTAASTALQYFDGSAWVAVSGPVTIAAGATSIQLRIATTDDSVAENSETFTVTTGYIADAVKNQDGVTATATITDNDAGGYTISAVSGNTTEAGGTATFTVKLASQPTADVVVTLVSDDSSEGTVTSGGTLTFTSANWNTAQQVVVTGVDDHLDDGDVAYHVNLSATSGDGFYSGLAGQASVTNTDDDTPPVISIGNVTVAESAGTATFTVTRTGASDDVVTVDYATQDTSATAGSDYTAASGHLTFAAGETSKTVVVSVSEDSIAEGSETFKVHLSNVNDTVSGNESIGTADGIGTITDNDSAGYSISAISGDTTEAGGTATFTVKLTSQPTADVVITVASDDTSEGTITAGATLTFNSSNWNTAQQVVVTGADDALDDGDIAYHVNLTGTSTDGNYGGRTGQVSVTNIDNDGPPTVSISDITVNEGAGTATFTVTRSGAIGDTTTVDFATADGTAAAGSDYTAASGTLTFAAGDPASKTVVVNISDDHLVESDETFTVTLSNVQDGTSASPAISGTGVATATIHDNDSAGLSIGSISGNTTEGGGTATFTIQLTSQPTSTVTVTLGTDDATEGLVTSATTLTFDSSNWNTAQVVTVTGQDDAIDDDDIAYHVTVSTASSDSHYNSLSGTVNVTNVDDDGPPVVSIGDVTVNEGDGTATFTVTRSGATGGVTTVDFATQDATATAGSDYTAQSGHLTFAASETSKTVVVAITDDAAAESSETFKVVLSNVADATSANESIGTGTGTATIIDNDSAVAPGFVIGAVSGDTTEAGGTATFTVKLTKAPIADVVITVGSDDTTEGTVFSGTSLTFNSANWNTTQTVVVKGVDDAVDDGDIGFHATLSASSPGDAGFNGLHTDVAVTNTDDDSPPLIAIGDISVNEADGTATFTVTRSGAIGDTTTVDFATQDGTAHAGSDYTAASGTLTFAANDPASKTIVVNINDDHLVEGSEAFDVVLSNVQDGTSTAASINPSTGTATIADNDTAGFTIGAVSGNTTEAGGTATFTVHLTSQPTADVVMTFASDDSTEGSVTTGATLTFTSANWNTDQQVVVTGANDNLDDGDIGYHINVSATSGDASYGGRSTQVSVTNTDDDGPPVISIGNATVDEAAGNATFTVTRTGASGDVVTVDYATQDVSATAGSDYTATNGTLTFAAGETSKTVVVAITDDTQQESSETFKVHLSNVGDAISSNESIATADGTGTITDNDSAGFTIGAISGDTTEAGGTATFTVKLTSQPTADVVITVASDDTTEGVVTAGATLTFTSANWNTAQQVVVTGHDDALDDGDIGYHLNLTGASTDANYGGRTGQVSVTNVDDDGPPTVSITDVTVSEADGTATFTVTRAGAIGDTTTVDFATADGTATAGGDYTAASGTLTFAAGDPASKTIVVSINDDPIDENDETFTVTLSNVHDGTSASAAISGTGVATGTIQDNDSAGINVGALTGHTTEAGGTATFTVSLSSQPTADVVITVVSSDAGEGTAAPVHLTFTSANWNTAQNVVVTGVDDHLDDGDIAYQVDMAANSADARYDALAAHANVTNDDNDGPPVISIGDISVNEGAGTATFTVTRTGASDDVVTVDVNTVDGTATGGSDYTSGSGTLTFLAGQTSKTVIVGITDDHVVEGNETFKVHLSNISDAISDNESIGTADGTATIVDDDTAGFTIGAISGNTTEAGGTASFTVKLTSQPTADVVITVASDDTSEGTAATTLTFNSSNWNVAQTVTVTGVDDHLDDGDIGYHVNLSAASGDSHYNSMTGQVNVTNIDDDGPPTVSISDMTVNEADGTATFTVTRTGADGGTTTVDFATANGTAAAGSDYTATSGTLTFAAGDPAAKTIVVAINDDPIDENDETFTVTLSNVHDGTSASAAIAGTGIATGTITDNDTAGLSISAISGSTTEAGGTATFTVQLTSQPTSDVVVTLASDDSSEGTVTGGATLTFNSSNWNTAQVVTVTGTDDQLDDGDIGYHVSVNVASGDANYDHRTASVSVTNIDNDGPPVISIGNASVNESAGTATFTVTRTGATGDTVTVDFATQDNTAAAGSDYTATNGTLTFAAGETSKTVVVSITDDHVVESSETFKVHLSNVGDAVSGNESIGTADGVGTITDNDTAGFTIGAISGNTTEAGGTASFTVKLTSQPTADVVITVSSDDTSEGTAATTLTFNSSNWNVAQTVTVTGVDDHLDDGDIGYHVNLSAASSDTQYDTMTGQVNVTNVDDDGPPVISVAGNVSVDEADGTATFTVTRAGASDDVVTVDYATQDNTATAGSDYTAASSTLTFAAGETSKTVVVSITDDSSVESSETFKLHLSNVNDTLSGSESIGTADGTGTIADNDTAGFTIGAISGNTTEAGGTASFTVKLTSQPSADVVITVSCDDASEGTVATTLTFNSSNWNVAQTVTVTGVDDHLDDGDIGYHVNLSAASGDGHYNSMTGQVSVTNTDDDGPPVISVGNASVNEADGTATFTVTRSGASDDVVTVDYATQDNTATAGSDYTATNGTLTFAAGETSKTVVVNVTDDHLVESSETFKVHLSNVSDAISSNEAIGAADGTGTIADNDSAGFTISAISGNTTEAGGTATFTIQLTSQPTADVVITFASDDASEGNVTAGATLTFNSSNWNTAQQVVVTGADDTIDDGDMGYHVNVSATSADSHYNAMTGQVNVTNTDDDGPPVVSIGNVTVSESDGAATFTVTRSGATGGATTVDWSTADGTATSAQDYTAASGTVSFGAGETSKTIVVSVTDDHSVESDETFTVHLSNVQDATSASESIGTGTGTATINDNDSAGFVIGPVSGNTTEAGGTASFTVKLTSQPAGDVVVTVTSDDTTEGSVNTTLTFNSGNWNAAQTVTVTGADDQLDDGDIGYTVHIAAASSDGDYNGKSTSASLTNADNDGPPVVSIGNASVGEADGLATFTVTRTGATGGATTVDWATGDGTATAGQDYTAASGTVTFAAGETSKTITVAVTDDHLVESSEGFSVTLSNVQDATSPAESIGQANGTATITDNDTAGFTIGAISGNTTEAGGTASFTVQLTSQPTADVVITVTSDDTSEGTAATTLTFNSSNWNVAQTVTVTGIDDHLDDGDIGYHVNLGAASSDGNYNSMTGQVDVTNTDDDGPPVISVGNASVNEGDGTATFTVTRSGAGDDIVTVDYATADGTAAAGSDYTAASGTLTFAAGETSKTVVVSITDDHSVESAETFTVALSNVNDALSGSESIGTATGTGTIADNDSAGFTLGVISGNTTEAGGTASFTVKLNSQPASDVIITVASDDTTEGTVNTTLTFTSANWDQVQAVTVTGVDDHFDDGDVGYHVNLSASSADADYDAMTGQVSVTNSDDDGPPVISIGNASVNESDGTATFTVTRTGASDDVVTVDYATQDGSATAGSDYDAASGTLTFGAGETSKTVVVNVTDDHLVESSETFKVHLSNVGDAISSNEAIGTADGTGTIADNDAAGFTISAINGDTTEAGGAASFTIQLTSQPTADVVITFASDDSSEGIVTAGATLTFNAANWNVAQTVVVTGSDDQLDDGDIGYHVSVSSSSSDANYDGTTASVSVTNEDNDGPPVISIGDVTVDEGAGFATFTVSRSGASDDVVTVDYATADGTAAAGSDYTAASGTVTFNAGELTKTLVVAIADDNVIESDETFTVGLSNVQDALSPAESIGTATGTGTITNNDVQGLGVTATQNVSEGATAVFTVSLTHPSDSTTEVTLALGSGADSADAGDYSSSLVAYYFDSGNNKIALPITGGKVVLPAFQTQFFVATATTQDSVYEGQEAFTLTASVPSATASGQATIVDDGTGITYDDKGNTVGGGGDDDRPVLTVVGSPDVSEGSHAVFTVMLSHPVAADSQIDLVLGGAGDSASASDYAPTFTAYYVDGGGNLQSLVVTSGGSVLLPAGVTRFYVDVDTIDDSVYEGRETFSLSANSAIARQGGTGAASIIDDGTGKFYDPKGNAIDGGTPDDDHTHIIVAGAPDVSEGSTAVFTVQFSAASAAVTEVTLQLGNGADTAQASDYSNAPVAYYYDANGVQQALAITNGKVVVPAGVTQFFVAVATTQDSVYEGRETFTLAAAITGGASDSGTAGIVDDGSGQVYGPHGTPTGEPGNDDRPTVTVDGLPDVSEGSNAIYTVHLSNPSDGPMDISIGVGAPGDTTSPNDYSASETAYYLDADGVRHDLPIVDGHLQLPPGITTFYVDVPTVQDSPRVLEGHETMTLDVAIDGGASGSGTSIVVDDGTGRVYDDSGNVTATPGDNDSPIGADLDPASDDGVSDTDHVTSVIDPYFTIDAGNLLNPGDTVQLVAPDGQVAGSSVVTASDAAAGTIDVQSWQLDDGTYEFTARVLDPGGNVVGEGPVHVTIVTDRDGVQPSIELTANGGDFNHDGIADWRQNNVAQLPVTSVSDYLAGAAAPASSFGAIIAGDVHQSAPGAAVALDPSAQLLDLSIANLPAPLTGNLLQASALFNFSVTAQDGQASLDDMDPTRAGLQTRVVIELPQGVNATGYVKWDSATHTWFSYMDDGNLDTYDDGATLLDTNGDGLVDRVVVTLTDGGAGDDDHVVNGMITDPGMLVLAAPAPAPAATPVFDVKLANGDHYYTTSAGEAAHMAQGTGNVLVGAAFDSLTTAQGGHAILANYNPFTMDWYFAASGAAMPYVCYEAMPGAGFGAANAGQGVGADYHLFMDVHGQTQLATLAQGAALGSGFVDKGAVFATTASSAFTFDVDGYLVANAGDQAVRDLVHTLSQQYAHTSDAGFVEAVEQDYLARVQLTGIAHGGAASAADVNAAFGTAFSA